MQMPSDIFESITVQRRAAGTWDTHGRWTEGAASTITVTGSVQPAGMRELMSLEEGERTKDTITIWTQSALYTIDEKTGQKADRVLHEGAYWQVRKVETFGATPELRHYHAIAVKEQAQ